MTKQEFAKIAMTLKTFYSREEKLIPNQQAMELWFDMLADMPYDLAEQAVKKWVATNKWSPSIADLRATAASIEQGDMPDWGKGWEAVKRAIRRFGMYNSEEAVESLEGITKECVKRLGFREICMSGNPEVERANFRMLYEQLSDQKKAQDQMPMELKRLIAERQKAIKGSSDLLRIGDIGG